MPKPLLESFVDDPLRAGESFDERRKRVGINCPKCNEEGKTHVLYETDNFYFCENPKCPVLRHFDGGYYILVKSDKKPVRVLQKPDDVAIVSSSTQMKKRVNDKGMD